MRATNNAGCILFPQMNLVSLCVFLLGGKPFNGVHLSIQMIPKASWSCGEQVLPLADVLLAKRVFLLCWSVPLSLSKWLSHYATQNGICSILPSGQLFIFLISATRHCWHSPSSSPCSAALVSFHPLELQIFKPCFFP